MATTFRRDHPKSRPLLKKIEGRWEVFCNYFTHPGLAQEAEAWCAEENSLTRAFTKRFQKAMKGG